jgi:hypothetical protein
LDCHWQMESCLDYYYVRWTEIEFSLVPQMEIHLGYGKVDWKNLYLDCHWQMECRLDYC